MAGQNITAADFPPGYLKEYQGNPPLAVASAFLPLEIVLVGLRFYARRLGRVEWGADDTLIIPGAFLCIALCVCAITNVIVGGAGHHQAELMLTDPHKLVLWAKYLVATPILYLAAVLFPKLAILAIYLRIFTEKPYRVACYIVAGIITANWIGTTVAGFLLCIPLDYTWDRTIPGGHCFDINSDFRLGSLANIVTDVVMLVLPLPVIWKIRTTSHIKIGLTITFATGSLGLITSIIRFISFFGEDASADGPWAAAPLLVWTVVETGTYLIAACLPRYRPLANLIWTKTSLSSLLSRTKTAGETAESPSNTASDHIPLDSWQKDGSTRSHDDG